MTVVNSDDSGQWGGRRRLTMRIEALVIRDGRHAIIFYMAGSDRHKWVRCTY